MSEPCFIMLQALRDNGKYVCGRWINDYSEKELEPFFVNISQIESVYVRSMHTSWLSLSNSEDEIAISGSVGEIADAINGAKGVQP